MTDPTSSNTTLQRRLGAMLYDGLLVLALLFAATIPIVALRGGEPVAQGNMLYQLLLIGVTYLFFTGFWYRYGRTLGMQSWGLHIETLEGERPTLSQCTLRFFLSIVSWLPVGMGFLWQLIDSQGLTWHDHLSSTRVRYTPKQKSD